MLLICNDATVLLVIMLQRCGWFSRACGNHVGVCVQVARLAKQLPSKTCDLFKMASYLAEKMEIAPPVVDADGFLEDSDGDVDLT